MAILVDADSYLLELSRSIQFAPGCASYLVVMNGVVTLLIQGK